MCTQIHGKTQAGILSDKAPSATLYHEAHPITLTFLVRGTYCKSNMACLFHETTRKDRLHVCTWHVWWGHAPSCTHAARPQAVAPHPSWQWPQAAASAAAAAGALVTPSPPPPAPRMLTWRTSPPRPRREHQPPQAQWRRCLQLLHPRQDQLPLLLLLLLPLPPPRGGSGSPPEAPSASRRVAARPSPPEPPPFLPAARCAAVTTW